MRWEAGQTQPLPWLRPKLAQALGVTGDRLEELLAASGAPPGPQDRAAAVPRQLPAAVADFTGRASELQALTRMLDQAEAGAPGTVVISAIGGTAGVGKTALAVHWAHQAAGQFPDGQLYVNLRGYHPDRPMPAGDALAGFLRSLGVGRQDIPADEDERAAWYRSILAGKKVLIVLDNARDERQVWPLLPGSGSCAVVVTSRDSLAGLVARHGARRLDLDLLPLAEAVGLLRALIGRRVEDDPGTGATLAGQCCRLPLAAGVLRLPRRALGASAHVEPEFTFATVRHRTKITRGSGSRAAGLAMAFKLIQAAQARWRAVNAPHLVALVRAGARFERGMLVERPESIAA